MILDRFKLTDQVAVVTGAGRGIGAATAVALAEAGADVVIASRTSAQLSEVAARVSAVGRRAHAVPVDLSSPDAAAALAATAVSEFGRLDLVVQSAAVMAYGTIEELPAEVFDQVVGGLGFRGGAAAHPAEGVAPHERLRGRHEQRAQRGSVALCQAQFCLVGGDYLSQFPEFRSRCSLCCRSFQAVAFVFLCGVHEVVAGLGEEIGLGSSRPA